MFGLTVFFVKKVVCNRVDEVACTVMDIQVRGLPFSVCLRWLAPGSLEIEFPPGSLEIEFRNCLFASFVACSGMYIGKRLALHCS